jgi:hypothetical protein
MNIHAKREPPLSILRRSRVMCQRDQRRSAGSKSTMYFIRTVPAKSPATNDLNRLCAVVFYPPIFLPFEATSSFIADSGLSGGIVARRGRRSRRIDRSSKVPERHLGGVLARLLHVVTIVPEASRVVTAVDDDDTGPGCAASCLE